MVAELQAFMIIFSKKLFEVSKKTSVRYKKVLYCGKPPKEKYKKIGENIKKA